jgi:O-antigen ligase
VPDQPRHRPSIGTALWALLLASTLTNEWKLPWLGVGWPNLTLPLLGALLLSALPRASEVLRRTRPVVLWAASALWAWALVASLLSPEPATALRFWVKGSLHLPLLAACLAWMADATRARQAARVLLAFLVLLALFGVLESAWPSGAPFRALRSAGSLSIEPRVAGLLPWPNQYGVLMALGLALAGELRARGLLRHVTHGWVTLLLLSQVAQSGSRNAWLVSVVALALLAWRGRLRWTQAGAWAATFGLLLVLLPVPAAQLGLGTRSPLVGVLLPERYRAHALADPLQSLSLRSKLWRAAAAELRARPVAGLGPGVFGTHVSPALLQRYGLNTHNLALEIAVALGLVGLVLAFVLLLALWRPQWLGQAAPAGAALTELPWLLLLLGQGVDCFVYDPTCVTVGLLLAAGVATADGPVPVQVPEPA